MWLNEGGVFVTVPPLQAGQPWRDHSYLAESIPHASPEPAVRCELPQQVGLLIPLGAGDQDRPGRQVVERIKVVRCVDERGIGVRRNTEEILREPVPVDPILEGSIEGDQIYIQKPRAVILSLDIGSQAVGEYPFRIPDEPEVALHEELGGGGDAVDT